MNPRTPPTKALRRLAAVALLATAMSAGAADELDLAIKSGCLACHRGAQKLIGPPYREVARKYAGRPDAVATLAAHIMNGTGPDGVGWMKAGKASLPFMPPNSGVKPREAERLAAWVLDMKGEIPGLADYVSERLSVSGAVEHPLDLSVDALRQLPASDLKEIAVVAPAPAKAGQTETFRGVLLKTLLDTAVVSAPGRHDLKRTFIVARASDNYVVLFTWNEIFNTAMGEGVLVYFERDGKPLGEDEGRIALISAKDLHLGARHVRWLKSVEIRRVTD